MQVAAQWSRALGAGAGAFVAGFGAATLLGRRTGVEVPRLTTGADAPSPTTTAALVAAGLALLLLAGPGGAPLRYRAGTVLAALAAVLGTLSLVDAGTTAPLTEAVSRLLVGPQHLFVPHAVPPAAGLGLLLIGLALVLVDRPAGGRTGLHPTGPLLVAVAVIALVALAPPMFAAGMARGPEPGTVMSPYAASGLLLLAAGALLARPERGPLTRHGGDTPGATVTRRIAVALLALPFLAALFSGLAAASGVERPTAAISTGAIVATLALLAAIGHLVRSLDDADRRQRRLVAELRERQEFSETLLQQMNAAVMVLDAERRVVEVNQRWQELTGQPAAAAVGHLPPYPWEPESDDGDLVVRRADGTGVPVLTTVAAMTGPGGGTHGFVATYVDISERKRAERALAEHAAAVEEKNRELSESNGRLEAALAFKSDLTSILSHDVSQPISSVASIAELITDAWDDMTDAERRQLLSKINQNGQRLVKMMNELSLLFRLDTGSVTARRTPVDVREVVRTSVDAVCDGNPDVQVEVDPGVAVLADREHLRHVLHALLKNAVQYGSAPVRVLARREPDHVVLVVQDAGRGIPAAQVPTLFDRFTRGSGMGLFIVRHLVEANGGAVRYEQAAPRGARLVVTLEPAQGVAAPSAPSDAAARTA